MNWFSLRVKSFLRKMKKMEKIKKTTERKRDIIIEKKKLTQ